VALVGGAATGIGRACAEALARDGARVVLAGRTAETLEAAALAIGDLGREKAAWQAHDFSDPASAASAVAEVVARFGSLDVLVLNAGGPPPGGVLDVTDDQWRSAFDLLVLGPLALARAALPGMAARGFGRVIVVTSTAVRQPQPDLALSVVLRSSMTAAAKLLSREYAAQGVTVNCVAPGPVATRRRADILASRAQRRGTTDTEEDAEDVQLVPAGRAARAEEVAAVVAFLASRAASYVNGSVVTVDGGRTETA